MRVYKEIREVSDKIEDLCPGLNLTDYQLGLLLGTLMDSFYYLGEENEELSVLTPQKEIERKTLYEVFDLSSLLAYQRVDNLTDALRDMPKDVSVKKAACTAKELAAADKALEVIDLIRDSLEKEEYEID